jgi:hypothetical protein
MEALRPLPSLRLYLLRCRHSPYPFGLHFLQISWYSVTAEPEPEAVFAHDSIPWELKKKVAQQKINTILKEKNGRDSDSDSNRRGRTALLGTLVPRVGIK